jgi:hypothetical protein
MPSFFTGDECDEANAINGQEKETCHETGPL